MWWEPLFESMLPSALLPVIGTLMRREYGRHRGPRGRPDIYDAEVCHAFTKLQEVDGVRAYLVVRPLGENKYAVQEVGL